MEEKNRPVFRDFYNHKDAGKAFLWAFIAPYILAFLVGLIVLYAAGKDVLYSVWFNVLAAILTPLCIICVYFVYNKIYKISFKAANLKFNLDYKKVLILIAISIICIIGLYYIINLIDVGLFNAGFKASERLEDGTIPPPIPLTNGWWYVLNLFALGVLPAIAEELIFRGLIFNGLRRNMKDYWAVIISAVMFMIMHANLEQVVYPFILGLVLAWVILRTGSLLSSIIIHMTNNFIVITISFITQMTGFDFLVTNSALNISLSVVFLLIAAAALILIEFFYFKNKSPKFKKVNFSTDEGLSEGRAPSFLLMLGFIIAVVVFVINTVSDFRPPA